MMHDMLTVQDIEHLATLARMELSDEEKSGFITALDPILNYVGELASVQVLPPDATPPYVPVNVVRSDDAPNAGGEYTQAIIDNAPRHERGYVRVPRILS
jgi:aspartyl-tRNA(Asn)/glutamyl-tRNA(Gln) amidotransferase subunit C